MPLPVRYLLRLAAALVLALLVLLATEASVAQGTGNRQRARTVGTRW